MPSQAEIADFLAREFPQTKCAVVSVGERTALVRHEVGTAELRPGGTVSGPVLMAVADVGLYVAILGTLGMALDCATTSLNVNFLRRPPGDAAILGQVTLLKVGRTLVVGEVSLFSEGRDEPVAHVVGTYALLPGSRTGGGSSPGA